MQAKRAYRRLAGAVEEFLQVRLNFLSHIPADDLVHESVARRKGVVQEFPSSQVARALTHLGETIDAEFHSRKVKGGMQFFFKQLLEAGAYAG
jgi:flagellar biosynthesis protein FlhG